MSNEEKVLEALKSAGEPLRPGSIAEMSGLSKDEVGKAVKNLKADGKINSPKRCFYAPV